MESDNRAGLLLRNWLDSDAGYSMITGLVKKKFASGSFEEQSLQLSLAISGYESPEERMRLFSHEFLSFLLSDMERTAEQSTFLQGALYSGQYTTFLEHTWTAFVWEQKNRNRLKQENPLGYMYRRFREAMTDFPEFTTLKNPSGRPFFSRAGDGEVRPDVEHTKGTVHGLINTLSNETYRDWPTLPTPLYPGPDGNFRVTTSWLAEVAEFFWFEARKRCSDTLFFPVSEIVRYLGVILPWIRMPLSVKTETAAGMDEVIHNDGVECHAQTNHTDQLQRMRQLESLLPLARHLVACWDRLESCVFSWRVVENPLTFADIAGRLELVNTNQAVTLFEKTKRTVKKFFATWPGPPPEELEPMVAEQFIEKVVDEARNKCEGS